MLVKREREGLQGEGGRRPKMAQKGLKKGERKRTHKKRKNLSGSAGKKKVKCHNHVRELDEFASLSELRKKSHPKGTAAKWKKKNNKEYHLSLGGKGKGGGLD